MAEIDKQPAIIIKCSDPVGYKTIKCLPIESNIKGYPINILFAYHNASNDKNFMPTQLLQTTLTEALNHFQTLTGRVVEDEHGNAIAHLTNEGILFTEATCSKNLDYFLPVKSTSTFDYTNINQTPSLSTYVCCDDWSGHCMSVQLTRLECKSVILCVSVFHCLMDAHSMAQFMKVWSEKQDWPNILWMNKAFISSEENFRRPLNCIFNKSNPEKQNQQQQQQLEEKEQKTIITKVHYFSSEEIRTIKKEASQRLLSNRYISSYDALYSHLCHVISKATQTDLEPSFKICQFFNGRRLFEKDEYFGSLAFWLYEHVTKCAIHQLSLSNLANIIHDMHEKQTINTLTKYNSYLDTGITIRSNYIDADIINSDYHATSWRNFGFYNIDFGYGKPMYTGPTIQLNQRYMTIMDTLLNDGSIYVILGLKQEDFQRMIEQNLLHKYV